MKLVLLSFALLTFSIHSFSQQLSANFTINPSPATVGATVTFTNTTVLNPDCGSPDYNWNFGANASPGTANTAGPHNVTYGVGGLKSITLAVTQGVTANCITGATDQETKTLQVNGVLPVELLNFSAVVQENAPFLTWSTASEVNNEYFVVSRSLDGKIFTAIGKVNGHGTSSSVNTYTFIDKDPVSSGSVYYRLSQVDLNGTETIKSTISLFVFKINSVSISPNPTSDYITVNLGAEMEGKATIEITNMIGQKMLIESFDAVKGFNFFRLDLSKLPAGYYHISIIQNGIIENRLISRG